jgi:hypothetical protein
MSGACYFDLIDPADSYDADRFFTVIEVSSSELLLKSDSGALVRMASPRPIPESEFGRFLGNRRVLREQV